MAVAGKIEWPCDECESYQEQICFFLYEYDKIYILTVSIIGTEKIDKGAKIFTLLPWEYNI